MDEIPEKAVWKPDLIPLKQEYARVMATDATLLILQRSFPTIDLRTDAGLIAEKIFTWLKRQDIPFDRPEATSRIVDSTLEIANALEWSASFPAEYTTWKSNGSLSDMLNTYKAFVEKHPDFLLNERVGVICETETVRLCQLYYPGAITAEGKKQGLCLSWRDWHPYYVDRTRIERDPSGEARRPRFELYSLRARKDILDAGDAIAYKAGQRIVTLEIDTLRGVVTQAECASTTQGGARYPIVPTPGSIAFAALFTIRDALNSEYDSVPEWSLKANAFPTLGIALEAGMAVSRDGVVVPFEIQKVNELVAARSIHVQASWSDEAVLRCAEIAAEIDMTGATQKQRDALEFVSRILIDRSVGAVSYPKLSYVGRDITTPNADSAAYPLLEHYSVQYSGPKLSHLLMPRLQLRKIISKLAVPDTCQIATAEASGTQTEVTAATLVAHT